MSFLKFGNMLIDSAEIGAIESLDRWMESEKNSGVSQPIILVLRAGAMFSERITYEQHKTFVDAWMKRVGNLS